jgi:hypothetical protein
MSIKEKPLKIKNFAIIALIVVVVIWGINLILYFVLIDDEPGQLGDVFGAANALFSGLALAGIVITLFMQRYEIKLQQKELTLQREELTETRGVFEQQTSLMSNQQNDNTFFNLLKNYREVVESFKIGKKKSLGKTERFNMPRGYIQEEISGYKVTEGISHSWDTAIKNYISVNKTSILRDFQGVEHPFLEIKNNHITEILVKNITNILKFIDSRFDKKSKEFYEKILISSLTVNEIYIYEVLTNNGLTEEIQYKNFFDFYQSYEYSGIERMELPLYSFNHDSENVALEVFNDVKIKNVILSDLKGKTESIKLNSQQTEKINLNNELIVKMLIEKSEIPQNNWVYLLFTIDFKGKEYHLPIEFYLEIRGASIENNYRITNFKYPSNSNKINKLISLI